MKVLIAGATGAIGRPLLGRLDDAGHELFALVRSGKTAGRRDATRVHEVVADALDAASVLEAVQHTKPDVGLIGQSGSGRVPERGRLQNLTAAFGGARGRQKAPIALHAHLLVPRRAESRSDPGTMPIWKRRRRNPD